MTYRTFYHRVLTDQKICGRPHSSPYTNHKGHPKKIQGMAPSSEMNSLFPNFSFSLYVLNDSAVLLVHFTYLPCMRKPPLRLLIFPMDVISRLGAGTRDSAACMTLQTS